VRDRQGSARKRLLFNAFLENAEGALELFVL
jgi:hypothetical protein